MHFETSAVASKMTPLIRRFVAITGWQPWRTRLDSLRKQIERNPLIEEYFAQNYQLELEMERLHRRIRLGRKVKLPEIYQEHMLLGFIAMVARTHQRLGSHGQRRLAGMLRSGLKADYGLVSLQHEMNIAAHLMSQGFDVTFSDIESGGFDMLASRAGIEIEVECKTFSGDVGRKIHWRRLFQFGEYAYPLMVSALDRRPGGHLALIKLPKRLDGNDQHLQGISKLLEQVLLDGMSAVQHDLCSIEHRTFSLTNSPFETTNPGRLEREVARKYAEQKAGFPINHVIILLRPNRGVVVIAVESAQPDEVMDGFVRRLKELVKGQITGKRPALICVRLSDVTEKQLVELANDDKAGRASSLQRATSMLLNRDDWRAVHTIGYFTPGHVIFSSSGDNQRLTRAAQGQGRTYIFKNPNHELASDSRLKIF